jgi:alpha-D-xyloside xylohydrolase
VEYATEKKWANLELRVYPGADGTFTLFEDELDNYNYEKGACSTIPITWNDAKKILTIGDRQGSFAGMLNERTFNIVWVSQNNGTGVGPAAKSDRTIGYNGKKVEVHR